MKGIRIILVVVASVVFLSSKAQTFMPGIGTGYTFWQPFPTYPMPGDSLHLKNAWHLSPYAAVTAGFGYFNGVGASFLSVPLGLQLSHPLNNNLVAFAAVSTAPSFLGMPRTFSGLGANNSYPGPYQSNAYGFGMNSKVELGLMYVNDARTFSISGSIGVESSSFPGYYPAQQRVAPQKNTR